MDNQELIDKLKKIVKPYVKDLEAFENLTAETNFISDLKINSANLVDVILDVEDEFDITIEDDAMDKMLTVQSAMDIIASKIGDHDRK
ncbi:MAG TPA: phosphopantetheine-binding protein [Saprospiraceae bacterium]|nr:phosphopantetheine-binding protein [Saprospiraceae bacterium]HOY12585.1 phosphopantetheine-binding protein [Saprospiraceae bacterium]